MFIPASRRQHIRTPDITMIGKDWEIKSPIGKSSRTIENTIRQALKQSPNIIIDLRNLDKRLPYKKYVDAAQFEFKKISAIKRLIVIVPGDQHLDMSRKH